MANEHDSATAHVTKQHCRPLAFDILTTYFFGYTSDGGRAATLTDRVDFPHGFFYQCSTKNTPRFGKLLK